MGRAAVWGFRVATTVVGCGYGGLTLQMWADRHDFEIKARSPSLIFATTLGGFAIMILMLLQWQKRAQGSSLPCAAMAYITPFASVFMAMPYLIRAVRLIVAHNPEYRYKFAKFVKWKPLTISWIVCVVIITTETVLVRHFMPINYCFATDPFLMGVATVFGGVPALVLARSLRSMYDPFGVRQEVELVLWTAITCGATNTLVQILVAVKTLPNSAGVHIFEEFVTFVFGAQVGIWSMLIPLASHNKWCRAPTLFRVLPRASSSSRSPPPVVGGVLDLAARSGDIGNRFGNYCEKYHVSESWDFILKVTAFKKIPEGTDEQHRAFVETVDQFISSASPTQINIDSDMKNQIMALRPREAFNGLGGSERRTALDKPLGEIVRLLEFNLLEKFWQTEHQRQDEELADIAKEDKNLMDIMVSGEKSAIGGRRGSSVNASRHRSSISLQSHADMFSSQSISTGPPRDDSSKWRALDEPLPLRLTPQLTTAPSSNSSSLQAREEKPECLSESSSVSQERPFFPYTRRSSQICPILPSIEANNPAVPEDRSVTRVSLDDASSARVALQE